MALPSLLVEYKSQRFRLARRENYDAIRFHIASIRADDTILLQTNDLSTCNGSWVDISGPIWPVVQSSLQRLRVTVEPARQEERDPTELMIHVELRDLERTMSVRVTRSTTSTQLREMIQHDASVATQKYYVSLRGRGMPPGDPMFAWGLNAGSTESTVHLVLAMKGAKPVIYICPPAGRSIEAQVNLSLVPEWEFSAIYPVVPAKATPAKGQAVSWTVVTLPDGNLRQTQTGLNVSYLYWEADTTAVGLWSPPASLLANGTGQDIETFIPNRPSLHVSNSVLFSLQELMPYLDKALLALGLNTEARTSNHKNVAMRFLPQEAYGKAAPLDVQPKPDVVARIFMLFQGIEDADLQKWGGASKRAEEPVELWAEVVGIDKARVLDQSAFRVIEWGGMEVRG
ncbi:hypothetical protein BKA70DRAFT_1403189 [Coprinopsis sp. MPI-PUGE-AT-0042]|nr:hypothetical protein BKA70DRAFT_1403189 [Coprinopsis sp. MPI-PUGE-AT-0042]